MRYTILCLILLTLCPFVSAEFIVQTIYFQPTDAPDLAEVQDKINLYSKQSQHLYASEMERHGYGLKTYKLETDNTGDVKIHHVKGNKKANFYQQGVTYNNVTAEFPNHLDVTTPPWDKQDKIRVIIVGGITLVNNKSWGVGFPFHSGRYGGACTLAGANANFNQHLIAHEIGHCFGLYHRTNCDTCLMGGGNTTLAKYEANWLDKHYHFNDHANRFVYPKKAWETPKVTTIDETYIRFELEVQSESGLHQAMMVRAHDIMVLGHTYFDAQFKDVVNIRVERSEMADIFLELMDIDGDYTIFSFPITLPPINPPIITVDPKNPDIVINEPIDTPIETDIPIKTDPDENIKYRIKPENKRIMSWGSMKRRHTIY